MSPEPLVSVIVPVHNGERHLGEALESVLVQTRGDLDVIVVDDGSKDGTRAVVESFGDRVRCVARSTARGSGAARNLGVAHARGRFVAFLDHDDRWAPDKLERQLEAFAADPDLDLVFGHVMAFLSPDLDARVAARLVCPEEPRPARQAGTLLARLETVRQVGEFDTERQGADFLGWLLRADERGLRYVILRDTVLWRRLHSENHSLRNPAASHDYLHALKGSLDRRRAMRGA